MADKWLTALADAKWVQESYGDEPGNPSAKVLVRAIYGVSRANSTAIIDALNATKSYATNTVYINGIVNSGVWRVIRNEARPSGEGSLNGSDVIIQTLGQGNFTTLSASNKFVLKDTYEPEEQSENAWLMYRRGTRLETVRWVNLTYAAMAALFPTSGSVSGASLAFSAVPLAGTYETPYIIENWYEKEQDGSYSLYRTLFARETTTVAAPSYRYVQYAGMLLTDTVASPLEGDTTIKISGFLNQTEKVHTHAKFSIGGDTYRVTADATAAAGVVTVSVVPEVTAATEALCDNDEGAAIQIYFEALS